MALWVMAYTNGLPCRLDANAGLVADTDVYKTIEFESVDMNLFGLCQVV